MSLKIILYFLRKNTFLVILPIKTLWDLSKTTDLVERIRMQFFCPKLIGERQSYGIFFSMLHLIWILLIFQFLVYALPNRMMTSPYKIKIHNLSLFCQPFILYGKAIVFNFWSMPSLQEYDKTLWTQKTPTWTNPTQPAAQPSCICQSLGKTISRIFEQRLSRVGLQGPNKRDAPI